MIPSAWCFPFKKIKEWWLRGRLSRIQTNLDIKVQIHNEIWTTAFSNGFSKAWDMMVPLMTEGIEKAKQKVREEAIERTMKGLEGEIQKRLAREFPTNFRKVSEIEVKKKDLEARLGEAKTAIDKARLKCYMEALDWVRNAN